MTFADLHDMTGWVQILWLSGPDDIGVDDAPSVGDFIAVEGYRYITQRQQLSLCVTKHEILTHVMRSPRVERGSGRVARPSHDALWMDMRTKSRDRHFVETRAAMLTQLRSQMALHDYLAIDSPCVDYLATGASARTFVTYHHAHKRELYLRSSLQLQLRRPIISGLERVYDLGRCFRNEGISKNHSPEFTMLEWSTAFSSYTDTMDFAEKLIVDTAVAINGNGRVRRYGQDFDLARPWRRVTVGELFDEYLGTDLFERRESDGYDKAAENPSSWSERVEQMYREAVEPKLLEPTIVYGWPVELASPLTRAANNAMFAETFDIVIGGIEIASGDSEITDPDEQRKRLMAQFPDGPTVAAQRHIDDEVEALEYGMPPTSGAGIGVDRLLMILTGADSVSHASPFAIRSG